ncbi:hypothetical protein KKI24_07110 [bacterium]|nr:hypothetical protein [bacterium]
MKDKPKKKAKILPFRKPKKDPFDVIAFAKQKLKDLGPEYSDYYSPKEPA